MTNRLMLLLSGVFVGLLLIIALICIMIIHKFVDQPKNKSSIQLISLDNNILRVEHNAPPSFNMKEHITCFCNQCDKFLYSIYFIAGETIAIDSFEYQCIYSSQYMKAYKYRRGSIFWISKSHQYCGTVSDLNNSNSIIKLDKKIRNEFYPFAKYMVLSKKWDCYKKFIDILISSSDQQGLAIAKRYAAGNFTKEELRLNINSQITKDEIIKYSNNMLNKLDRK